MIEAGQSTTTVFGGAGALWVALSVVYTLLIKGSLGKSLKKGATFYEAKATVRFKALFGWITPRSVVAVTNDDLLLGAHPVTTTAFCFSAFDTPIMIPRAKIQSARMARWWFLNASVVEVEYDNAGERDVVQLAVRDSARLLLMLANTRSDEADEDAGDDDREEAR